jgi:hypothetical protein
MDILDILSLDERIIVLSDWETRSLITWNQSDTLQWWRPKVRIRKADYPKGQHDPNDWEEVTILTQSGYGPKTFKEARKVAQDWINGALPFTAGEEQKP